MPAKTRRGRDACAPRRVCRPKCEHVRDLQVWLYGVIIRQSEHMICIMKAPGSHRGEANDVGKTKGAGINLAGSLCGLLGLEYFHFPELGIPASSREKLHCKEDYEGLFKEYKYSILSVQHTTLRRLARMVNDRPIVLVCMEADPTYCHRTTLAEALSPIAWLPVKHLEWPR